MRLTLSLIALSICPALLADDWPQFRGPSGDGHATAKDLPLEWSEEKNVTWKVPVPGKGWSTPIISGEQIWLTTATEDGKEMSVICLDRKSGKILFTEVAFTNQSVEPLGNPVNCYSSPTGCIEPGRVFVHFGSYGTACYDTKTFKKAWERRDLPCSHLRGPGSSLVAWKNTIILTMDGTDHQYVVALDKNTGENVWKTERSTKWDDIDENGKAKMDGDFRKAYSTPIFAKVGGKDQLISTGAKSTFGYDPNTGEEIWKIFYTGFSNASAPVYANGITYLNTGYTKSNLWALKVDGASGEQDAAKLLWEETKRVPLRASPLIHEGILYMISDDGNVSALNAQSGEAIWQERLPGNFSASPILAEGRLYFCNEQDESFILTAGREYEVLAQNKLKDGLMASPVAVGSELYLRTRSHIYRIEKK